MLDETRHLPLELCRGQTLHYAHVNAAGGEGRCGARAVAAVVEPEAEPGPEPELSRLGVGVSGTVYILPLPGRLVCGGTHEPSEDAAQAEPPCAAAAAALLASSLLELCPGLTALGVPLVRARAGTIARARVGVRVGLGRGRGRGSEGEG